MAGARPRTDGRSVRRGLAGLDHAATNAAQRGRKPADGDGFRPDLEGLRAVAVLLVLAFHARVPGIGGGFVGVDVFFVLSGFLITRLLLRERSQSGTISLPTFYARRARRLLPASLFVLLVTLVAAVIVLPPLQVVDVGGDIAAAALYVSNLRFGLQATDYFQAAQAPSPVLHYWSLGVEEQFYVLWPAIILLVGHGAARVRRRVGPSVIAISIGSFLLALWLTGANQPWAFYSLPTRAWELGLGAILAVQAARLSTIPVALSAVLGWAGLGLVVLSGVVVSVDTPFPGTAALMPTVGSALVILAGARSNQLGAGRLLGTALPCFLGRISYSLYLWHWPLLILPEAAIGQPLPWWGRGTMVLVAIGLAALTQRWVEDPLRRGRIIGTLPRRNLAMAGAFSLIVAVASVGLGAVTVAGLGGGGGNAAADEANLHSILGAAPSVARSARTSTSASAGPPSPTLVASPTPPMTVDRPVPADLRPSLAEAHGDFTLAGVQGCFVLVEGTSSPACIYGDPQGSRTAVLFGDSHALSWFPAVDRIATANGWRLINLTKTACGAADVVQWLSSLRRTYAECSQWRTDSFARIARERPALVILTSSRGLAIVEGDRVLHGAEAVAPWQAGLERTISRIASPDTKVTVIGDTPRSAFDLPVCLSKHRDSIVACATPYTDAVAPDWVAAGAAAAAAGDATFIDPTAWICPSRPCPPVVGNFLVFRDLQHLATPFSAALAEYLGPALPLGP
ncbi:MAG: acyltransferase family protein [Chloroflexota bacterium]